MCIKKWVMATLVIICLSGCGISLPTTNTQSPGTVMDPPKAITVEKLFTNQSGKSAYLSDYKGRVALIFFGYTNCPDVCPVTVSDFTRIKALLGSQADQVAFIFITVDPKRDTPEVLARYLGAFDPSFIGLRTDEEALRTLAKEFYTTFGADDAKGIVEHGTRTYLLDRKGLWRVSYPVGTPVKAIADDVKVWLE